MNDEHGFASRLDADVLARAQRGDRAALECIYRTYVRPSLALAQRMLGRHAAAEDAVHDGFLLAFDRLGSFRGEAPFGAWLKRLMLNQLIDRLRAERRHGEEAWNEDSRPWQDQPEVELDGQQLLLRLPPRARAVVWLHQMEGYSHLEIGRLFGQTESWSKSTLARSLERLRSHLAVRSHR